MLLLWKLTCQRNTFPSFCCLVRCDDEKRFYQMEQFVLLCILRLLLCRDIANSIHSSSYVCILCYTLAPLEYRKKNRQHTHRHIKAWVRRDECATSLVYHCTHTISAKTINSNNQPKQSTKHQHRTIESS